MNEQSLYDNFNQAIQVACAAWQQAHQAILTSKGQQRERLLFEEQQLECQVQHLMDDYVAYQRQQRTDKEGM